MHAYQFPPEALEALSTDAASFYSSYIEVDTFNFASAEVLAIESATKIPGAALSLAADGPVLHTIYLHGRTSLLDDPTAYLSRLHASALPWHFSSTLMSQASGLLLGYESIVSRDLLNATVKQATVTPGMSISVGPVATTTGATAATQATSTSKAIGVPAATGNPQLVFGAAAAVAGMLGMIML
ncbi:MAG: hypothetical protein M1830_002968 [Pleopsidium flavum]|nr:MAG: hypothetical protein M1830_002968 [Pleopsidium flavum]